MASLPWLLFALYLALLTLASLARPKTPTGTAEPRFAVLVPAHNESAGIARTVQSLRSLEWPADWLRVSVIADNCTDDTAVQAQQAGATVLVRTNPEQRGKGYALDWAFERVLEEGWAEAVVVVDADTLASPQPSGGRGGPDCGRAPVRSRRTTPSRSGMIRGEPG